jgi:hypothetical protein
VLDLRHTGRIELLDGTVVEPTQLSIELHGVAVAEFDGDEICALRQYWNVNSLLEQLGEARRPTSEIAPRCSATPAEMSAVIARSS